MSRRIPFACTSTLVCLLFLLSGCSYVMQHKATEDRIQNVAHSPGARIHVQSSNGKVHIVADPARADVEIKTNVRSAGNTPEEAQARLKAIQVLATREADGSLFVRASFPEKRRGNEGCSFTITIPDANGCTVDTSNGRITVAGLAGDANLTTSNGSIELTDQAGAAVLRSSNGRITARNIQGGVDAGTSNGSIDISGSTGAIAADTSNGSITLDLTQTGEPFQADTSNGSVKVIVSSQWGRIIQTDTSNASTKVHGNVSSNTGSKTERTIVVGEGGPTSNIDTSNGSITVEVK